MLESNGESIFGNEDRLKYSIEEKPSLLSERTHHYV